MHLLLSYPPQKLLSNLIANLKVTASKTMWREYADNISKLYSQKVFWTGSYFVASCGGVTIEQLKQYVDNQDCPDSSLGCHLGFPQMFICPVASIKLFAERCGSSFGLPQTLDKNFTFLHGGLDPSSQRLYTVLYRCTLMVGRVAQAALSFLLNLSIIKV